MDVDAILYPLADGLDRSALATWIKASTWIVPWAGAAHLLALGLLGGATLLVDLRLLGGGLTSVSPARLLRTTRPLLLAALAVMIATGSIVALGEVMKLYYSPPYGLKMASLAAALLFTFAVRDPLIRRPDSAKPFTWLGLSIALGLWTAAFLANAERYAYIALAVLWLALAVYAWIHRRNADQPSAIRLAAGLSLTLWLTTAAAGRWIAFY